MATKKQQGKNTNTKKWWTRPGTRIIIIILVILLVTTGFFWIQNISKASVEKERMTAYLNVKYGKKFMVTNFRIEGGGLAVKGDPMADAYSSEDKSLKFKVWDRGDYNFSDEYPGAIWTKEETKRLKPILTDIFGYTPNYTVNVYSASTLGNEVRGDVPTFAIASERYGSRIFRKVAIIAKEPVRHDSKLMVAERSEKAIKSIMELNANTTFIYNGKNVHGGLSVSSIDPKEIPSIDTLVNRVVIGEYR